MNEKELKLARRRFHQHALQTTTRSTLHSGIATRTDAISQPDPETVRILASSGSGESDMFDYRYADGP